LGKPLEGFTQTEGQMVEEAAVVLSLEGWARLLTCGIGMKGSFMEQSNQ